ncbi:MAG: exodeoxyribonuclease V subunit alpha, partial [Acidimicrobiia bacterium]
MTTVDPVEVAATEPDPEFDRFDVRRARHAPGILGAFNHAGVLNAADIHVATRLAAINGDASEKVLLAAALAVRAPRLGHVCTDLSTVRHTVTVDADLPVDVSSLPWPDPADWVSDLHASGLVAVGLGGATDRPLRLVDTLLYLDRYWREERQVAAALSSRAGQPAADLDTETLAEGLERIFGPGPGDGTDLQRRAAMTALARRLAVVAGGPGTGKTTT